MIGLVVEIAHDLQDGARALTILCVQAVGQSGDCFGVRSEAFQDTGDLFVDAESGLAADDLPAMQDRDRLGSSDTAAANGGLVGCEPEDGCNVCCGDVAAG